MGRWGLKGIIAVDACGGAVPDSVTDPYAQIPTMRIGVAMERFA